MHRQLAMPIRDNNNFMRVKNCIVTINRDLKRQI
jgi:hypothetical protein